MLFVHRFPVLSLAALCIIGCSAGYAAENDIKALQEALALINLEQQAVYQQFQMVQQLRRSNAEPAIPPIGGGAPGNYDDVIAARKAQADRDDGYARELEDLYRRHRELEEQKRPLLESLQRLRQAPARAP